MANQYLTLPVPTGNGVGAAVDTSTCGAVKTIVVGQGTAPADALTTIEISLDGGPTGWSAIGTVQGAGSFTAQNACKYMRVRVQNWKSGATSVSVGSDVEGGQFANLPAPVGAGAGTAVDISTFTGELKTMQISGTYRGGVAVELSEDGTSYSEFMTFTTPGVLSALAIAKYARVRRMNVPVVDPGLPLVSLGAVPPPGGSSGGSAGYPERFTYTATGTETNDFRITLPAARATLDYVVTATPGDAVGLLVLSFPNAVVGDRTTTSFRALFSAAPFAGDRFDIVIADRT